MDHDETLSGSGEPKPTPLLEGAVSSSGQEVAVGTEQPQSRGAVDVVPEQPDDAVAAVGQAFARPAGERAVGRARGEGERVVHGPESGAAVDVVPKNTRVVVR